MAVYKLVGLDEQASWDELVGHPLQSWAWGEFRSLRQPITRLGKYEGNKLKKGYLIVWTKLPLVPGYFGYVPMGEGVDDEDLKEMVKQARGMRGVGVRLEPNIVKGSPEEEGLKKLRRGRNLFKPKTYWWNLGKSEEELLKEIHPKARYNIKVAQRHGVEVKEDRLSVDEYIKLLFMGTASRQKIGVHDENYHRQLLTSLGDMARLFVARYQGKVISAMVVLSWKNTAYYAYGANSLEHKEVMASTALMWEVAKRLKKEGFEKWDLWGAEEGKGFNRFKQQFGAELVEMAGTFDVPVEPMAYGLFRVIEEVRWKIRHWRG